MIRVTVGLSVSCSRITYNSPQYLRFLIDISKIYNIGMSSCSRTWDCSSIQLLNHIKHIKRNSSISSIQTHILRTTKYRYKERTILRSLTYSRIKSLIPLLAFKMMAFMFISASIAFIPAVFAAAVPLDSRQAGVWGNPGDISVQYCYCKGPLQIIISLVHLLMKTPGDGDCIAVRQLWQSCQVDHSTPVGSPDARNELVASCLCAGDYVGAQSGCIACLSSSSQNFLVLSTQEANAKKLCNKAMTLSQYESYSLQFGGFLQFPVILPSLWIRGTSLTYPDQILAK